MVRRNNTQKNYLQCCTSMDVAIKSQKIPLIYCEVKRAYKIPMIDGMCQCIKHCPWCGNKLPDRLNEQYYEMLENKFDIDPEDEPERIPKEFKSDEWWRKRGL